MCHSACQNREPGHIHSIYWKHYHAHTFSAENCNRLEVSHGFFLHFNSPTWRFKTGFGGRVIPTKRSMQGQAASFKPPDAPVLPHPLHDADAEVLRKKMLEEKGEERESSAMQGQVWKLVMVQLQLRCP